MTITLYRYTYKTKLDEYVQSKWSSAAWDTYHPDYDDEAVLLKTEEKVLVVNK